MISRVDSSDRSFRSRYIIRQIKFHTRDEFCFEDLPLLRINVVGIVFNSNSKSDFHLFPIDSSDFFKTGNEASTEQKRRLLR